MDLNDPRFNKALKSYQRAMIQKRRMEGIDNLKQQAASNNYAKFLTPQVQASIKPPISSNGHLKGLPQLNNFLSQTYSIVQALDQRLQQAANTINQIMSPVMRASTAIGNMIERLPDFTPAFQELAEAFQRYMAEVAEGEAILEASDYGFADNLWHGFYMASFSRLSNTPAQTRNAVVTNKLYTATCEDDFVEDFVDCFENSIYLKRRWSKVEPAYEAHQRGEYALSIPALLPQIEGTIVDILKLKGRTVKQNGKLYLRGEDGERRRNQDGKRIGPVMLGAAANEAKKLEEHPSIESVSTFVADSMVQSRNEILHGESLRYPERKISVQCVLILAILANALNRLEEEKNSD